MGIVIILWNSPPPLRSVVTNKYLNMKSYLTKASLRNVTGVLLALFSLVILGCLAEEPPTTESSENLVVQQNATRASGPSASGHGTISLDVIPPNGEGFRQFSFHAREKKNGSIQGNGVLTYIGGQLNLKFDITCLNVSGNSAIMSGVVTQNQQNPAQVGSLCWFAVVDNGEGNNADPDTMALFYTGTDPAVYDCANEFEVPYYDIEGGNIQVSE